MPPCRCSLCEGAERATHTIAVHMRNEIKIRFVKMQKERQQEQQQEQQQQQQQAQQEGASRQQRTGLGINFFGYQF
eukprot:m.290441 g.290441  ORF g.290441 m.290441 type:complete len:76 (+) comp22950_c2_seq30:797-1024(+)